MEQAKSETTSIALETIITNAVKLPGVKVNRNKFLAETFAKEGDKLPSIISMGPVSAGISREHIEKIADRLIITRTSQSSVASFVAGIPGGLAMAVTIPADVAQFFGIALRLAQELSYLYGATDLWEENQLDDERARNQLILYCGVMFGVSGAVSGVRFLSAQIAKATLNKLPQKALTKTFWYPIVKQICKAIGIKVTKTTVAQSISKAVPIVGGVVSGTLNFVSMMPMANRLNKALNEGCFDYTEEKMADDAEILESMDAEDEKETDSAKKGKFSKFISSSKNTIQSGLKKVAFDANSILDKIKSDKPKDEAKGALISYDEKIETLRKLKQLVDEGILTQDEFDIKKKEILEL